MTNSGHVHHSNIWAPAQFNYFLEEWRDQQCCEECLAFQSDIQQHLWAGLGLSLRSVSCHSKWLSKLPKCAQGDEGLCSVALSGNTDVTSITSHFTLWMSSMGHMSYCCGLQVGTEICNPPLSLLQLPWFLHAGQLKPRAMVFFPVWLSWAPSPGQNL